MRTTTTMVLGVWLAACGDPTSTVAPAPAAPSTAPSEPPRPVAEPVTPPAEPAAPVEPTAPVEPAAPALPPPVLGEAGGLRMLELVLAPDVVDRQPVSPGTTFSKASTSRIYVWMRVENESRAENEIWIRWERADAPQPPRAMPLSIRAQPTYTTFAFTGTNRPTGRYRVHIGAGDDETLASAEFELTD